MKLNSFLIKLQNLIRQNGSSLLILMGIRLNQANIKFGWKKDFFNIEDSITRYIIKSSQMQK